MPKALTAGVARPQEAHVARRVRRGAEVPGDRLGEAAAGQVFPLHAVEDILPGRQTGEIDARGEVGGLLRIRAAHALRVGKARLRRPLHPQARGAVAARPHDAAIGVHVTALHARRKTRPRALAGDHRWCLRMRQDAGQAAGGGRRAGDQQTAAVADEGGHGVKCLLDAMTKQQRRDARGQACQCVDTPLGRVSAGAAATRRWHRPARSGPSSRPAPA